MSTIRQGFAAARYGIEFGGHHAGGAPMTADQARRLVAAAPWGHIAAASASAAATAGTTTATGAPTATTACASAATTTATAGSGAAAAASASAATPACTTAAAGTAASRPGAAGVTRAGAASAATAAAARGRDGHIAGAGGNSAASGVGHRNRGRARGDSCSRRRSYFGRGGGEDDFVLSRRRLQHRTTRDSGADRHGDGQSCRQGGNVATIASHYGGAPCHEKIFSVSHSSPPVTTSLETIHEVARRARPSSRKRSLATGSSRDPGRGWTY
jgi:hypothetical protein